MDAQSLSSRIESGCRAIGLDPEQAAQVAHMPEVAAAQQELERLHDERMQIVELIGARSPDKLLHDLRNVLNELALLQAIAGEKD